MIKLKDILSEAPKIKANQKISKKEWRKIKKFNKHIGQDGTHYVMQLTNKGTALVPVVVEGKLNEKTLWFDEETSQVSKLESEIDGFIANGKYKNLLKHDDPKVKQWIKQVIPMLKKSQGLLGKIYNKTLGT